MIYLAEACNELDIDGQKTYSLDFRCENCNQSFNDQTFNLSILLYGAAFLVGPKFVHVGFTCPNCINTMMLKGESLTVFQQIMTILRGPNGSYKISQLRYNSSVIYSPAQIKQLDSYKIATWVCPLTENSKENFYGMLSSYLEEMPDEEMPDEEMPDLEQDYFCSYIYGGENPMGSFTSIWWFKPDDIEALLQIENENQIRVFPRYFHKMSWYERYDFFCWQYRLYQEYLADLKKSADGSFNLLSEYAYQDNINLDRFCESNQGIAIKETIESTEQQAQEKFENDIQVASEFLDLLVNFDPAPWDVPGAMSDFYKGMWKSPTPFKGMFKSPTPFKIMWKSPTPFKGMWKSPTPLKVTSALDNWGKFNKRKNKTAISDAEVKEISDKVRAHITKGHVLDWAVDHHQDFIKDYISLARRSDFSYGYVWELKCRYLKQLYDIVDTVEFDETKYAFVSEENAWRIKFDGKVIGGLTGKGFRYIHYLVANQGKEFNVFDLGSLDGDSKSIIQECTSEDIYKKGDSVGKKHKSIKANDIVDPELKKTYLQRIAELELEIEDAKKIGHDQLLKESESELKMLKKQFNEDFWNGKPRQFDDGTMKARRAIARTITRAIVEIKGEKPVNQNEFRSRVASHFRASLRPISLYKISYTPKEKIDWKLN